MPRAATHLLDTLENPELIPVVRVGAASGSGNSCGVLSPALDAADCAQAMNSIEKMLCHQMAALHDGLPAAEQARMTNAAARVFEV